MHLPANAAVRFTPQRRFCFPAARNRGMLGLGLANSSNFVKRLQQTIQLVRPIQYPRDNIYFILLLELG
jgi:hypothetical protein